MRLSLRRNFSWTFLGNVVYAGFRWGILVVLAKMGSTEMVGRYALGLAVVEPLFKFGNMHLRAVLATDTKREQVFNDYLGLRLLTSVLTVLMVIGITAAVGYGLETALVIMVVALTRAFDSVSDVFHGLLQQHERMDRISKSLMLKGPLSLALLGMGVYLTGDLLWGVVGLAVAGLLMLIGYDMRSGMMVLTNSGISLGGGIRRQAAKVKEYLRPHFHINVLKKLAWLAVPLGLGMMLLGLAENIPRYFIERYFGEGQLGIFAAVASLMTVGGMVVKALGQSASPRLAKYYAAGDYTSFRTLLLKMTGLAVLLGVAGFMVAMVAGGEILTLLYRPEYGEHVEMLLWIMAAAGISYIASFLGQGINAARYFRPQVPLFGLVAGVTAIACFLLVPGEGLRGAAMAILIGVSVQAGCCLLLVWYVLWRPGIEQPMEKVRRQNAEA